MLLKYKGEPAFIKEVGKHLKTGQEISADERLVIKFPRLFEIIGEEKLEPQKKFISQMKVSEVGTQCPVCGKICKSPSGLKLHIKIHDRTPIKKG